MGADFFVEIFLCLYLSMLRLINGTRSRYHASQRVRCNNLTLFASFSAPSCTKPGLHQRRGQAPSTGNFSDWFLINSSAISAAQFSHKHKNSKADPTHRWVGFTVIIVSVATMLAQTGLAQAPSQRDIILHSGGQYGPYHCHRLQPQGHRPRHNHRAGHRAGHGPLLPTGPGTGKPQGLQNILAQVLIIAHILQMIFHIGLVYHYLRTGHFWRVK